MNIARLATISLVAFSVFSTGCIGCIDDEEGNSGTNNANNTNNVVTPTADCQEGDVEGVIEDGDFDQDVVLCGEITLQDDFRTTGPITVTIRPGTVINVSVDTFFELGWNSNEVQVLAQGTAENPIVFQGTTPDPGHWDKVIIRPTVTSDSVFSFVEIRHAGVDGAPALLIDNTRGFTFNDVTVENVGGPGVESNGFGDEPANLTVSGADGYAVVASSLNGVHTLPLGGTFTGNTTDAIAIAEGDFDSDIVFEDPGVPYVVEDNIRTTGTLDFTINAGVEIQLTSDTSIEFGWNNNEVKLTIAGTEANPVRFVGTTPEAGHWNTVIIGSTITSDSSIDFVEVEHAGSADRPGFVFESAISFTNATFRNNAGADLSVNAEGLADDSANVTCERTDGASAQIHLNAAMTLPLGGSYGSGDAYVEITEGDVTIGGTISAIDVPYRVVDNIRTTAPIDLTIEAGAIFELESDRSIEIGWNNNEVTANIDGATFRGTDPSPGHWSRFIIGDTVTSSSSVTNNTFSHAGVGSAASVAIDNPNITFTGNTINEAGGVCIDRGNDTTDYAASNTLSCTAGDYNT